MVGNWSSFQEVASYALCASYSFHSWEKISTTCFCKCLILKRVSEYNHITRTLQPMTPSIPSKDTLVVMCQLHPPSLNLVLPPIFDYQHEHTFVLNKTLFTQALTIAPHLSSSGFLGWYMNISWDASYQRTHPQGFQNYFRLLLLLFMGISLGRWL